MITRIYNAIIEMACCRDGVEIYQPMPRTIFREVRKPHFKESFSIWKKRIELLLDIKYRKMAKDECDKVGTRRLCLFNMIFSASEAASVTGVAYKTLRMAARGSSHIYGLSDNEFYKRMSKRREKFTKQQSRQLLKLFKSGMITTKAKV